MVDIVIQRSITITDQSMLDQLAHMVERMDDPSGFFRGVGEHLMRTLDDNFRGEHDPDGKPWTPLKPATIKARERKRQVPITILRASGGLRGSFNLRVADTWLSIGSPKPYAAIHFLGGTIKRAARKQTIYQRYDEKTDSLDQKFRRKSQSNFAREVSVGAHKITIPARPYVGVTKEDEQIIFGIADDWLRG